MKIAVIGAGAIGSVVAAYLEKAGEEVVLIGRPPQVEAINKSGLHVRGVRGDEKFQIPALTCLDKPYDLVIFSVKTQDLEQAYQDNQDVLGEGCWVLTTQNGVQADNMISTHFDKDKVISSIVMFGATYMKPGEVTYNFDGKWIIGKPFMMNDHFVRNLGERFSKAFDVVVTQDIVGMKWLKLFVNFHNCIPALIGKSMQETFSDIDLCKISIRILKEGVAIVQEAGIELVSLPDFPAERVVRMAQMPLEQAADILQKVLTTLSKEPLYGSILQSILRGKTSEIDFINGEVVALARHLGKTVPLNEKVVDMVHQVERIGKFFTADEVKKALNQR